LKIPMRPDGTSKGIAFIEFASSIDSTKAMNAEQGKSFEGRNFKISYSSEKPDPNG
jgi:RNA recognition motif-containing protein